MRGTRNHYENVTGKYDAIDVGNHYKLNFNRGSAVKYIIRAGKKDSEIGDLEKSIDFLQREVEWLREQQEIWIENNK